jgi:uncharacterized membrane protein
MGVCTRVLLVVGLGCGLARAAEAQPRFRVKAIIHPSTGQVEGTLNDAERFAGFDVVPPNLTRTPYYWDGTGKHLLPFAPDDSDAEALSMNAKGQIVGRTYNGNLAPPYHAVEWENGHITALPLPSGFAYGEARGINALGDIIGHVAGDPYLYATLYRGAFWHDGQVTLIGGDRTALMAINAHRQIVGCAGTTQPYFANFHDGTPFIWDNGTYRTLPGVSSTAIGCAYGINDSGVIVGHSGGKPVMWQSGMVLNINPPYIPGTAAEINNRGEVIGQVETIRTTRFFFRPTSGGLYDLAGLVDPPTDPPYHVFGPAHFNNAGELMMGALAEGGEQVQVVLAPATPAGTDTQPPTVTLTSPTTGSYVADAVVFQANATDNVGVAGVQFFADGSAVGPEITAPPYTFELDLVKFDRYENGALLVWARARDAAGNVSLTNMKSVMISNRCYFATHGQTINGWLGSQTGTFTVRWTGHADVGGNFMDGGFGLSNGNQTYFSGTSASVLWAPDGELKVRDGDHYPASGYPFDGSYYRFRMVVDVPSNRYAVWVRHLNEPEHQLASGYAFRKAVTSLDSWMMRVDDTAVEDSLRVCNVSVKQGS